MLSKNINASLGQTLVFFAQPVGNIYDNNDFAEACVKAIITEDIFNKLKLSCQGKGRLLNSPIFEYNNDADSPEEQCHILIWLNLNQQTTALEETGEYYYPLIDLLNCRSKIMYVFSESRKCYQQARDAYSKLEDKVIQYNQFKNQPVDHKLKKFNQWLNEIPNISFNYAHNLSDLELHKTTIKTNLKNYKLYLNKIKRICVENDLEFLSSFAELAEDTFIEQINTDLAYLTPGQNLFELLFDSIRGIVEIEQTKRNRDLEQTIHVASVALGSGAIVVGATSHIDKPPKPVNGNYPFHLHPSISSFLLSCVAAFIAALLMCLYLWTKRQLNSTKKPK